MERRFRPPKLSKPFTGDPLGVDDFLCELEIQFEAYSIENDKEKIGTLMSNVGGTAAMWVRNYQKHAIQSQDLGMKKYSTLAVAFRQHHRAGVNVAFVFLQLQNMKQTNSLAAYTAEFQKILMIIEQDLPVSTMIAGLLYTNRKKSEDRRYCIANRLCFKCKKPGHSIKDCLQRTQK